MNKVNLALKHKDILGAGAKRRNELDLNKKEEIEAIMKEFDRGTLHSGSGAIVKSKKQALAIGYSEYRRRK